MGNREDLLAGAKRCLYDKGYARTTARDIATASGVSLAAIGYHFGSKEALLKAAIEQAIEEWGDDLARLLAEETASDADPATRFAATWDKVVQSFARSGQLWAVQFELLAHVQRDPALRASFADATRPARLGLAGLFGQGADEETALNVGALYQALLSGLAAQSMADPANVPSGRDLLDAVQMVAAGLCDGEAGSGA